MACCDRIPSTNEFENDDWALAILATCRHLRSFGTLFADSRQRRSRKCRAGVLVAASALRPWRKLNHRGDAEAKPFPTRGVCESHSFWQAVVTNSCCFPDAVIDIHAPVNASTGQLNRLAAVILISETKALPQGQRGWPRGSGLPEKSSSGHNRVVVDSLTDLVFGCRVDVLSLQVDPLRQLVAGEANPGRVVFDEATCPCRCVWWHW